MNWQDLHFLKFNVLDLLDILFVAIIIYLLYNLLKGTIAVNIFIGLCLIALFYWIVKAFHMELLTGILDKFLSVGVIAVMIIFQQEIRGFLLMLGKNFTNNRTKFWGRLVSSPVNEQEKNYDKIKPILEACTFLQLTKTGALLVFAQNFEEQVFYNNGELLQSTVSKRLLESIFNKTSPLHDGAVVIADNQIKLAACILPISNNTELPVNFGLRHRAGLGITEHSNSVSLIVSEETGEIAFAKEGKLKVNISLPELERILYKEFA